MREGERRVQQIKAFHEAAGGRRQPISFSSPLFAFVVSNPPCASACQLPSEFRGTNQVCKTLCVIKYLQGQGPGDAVKLEKREDPCLKTYPWSDDSAASCALAHAWLQHWCSFRQVLQSISAEHQAQLVTPS